MGRVKDINRRLVFFAEAMARARARFDSTMGPKMMPRQIGAKGISKVQ